MNLYIWNNVYSLTDSWHDGGGVVACARDLDHVQELYLSLKYREEEKTRIDLSKDEKPDRIILNVPSDPFIHIFPDAGCC